MEVKIFSGRVVSWLSRRMLIREGWVSESEKKSSGGCPGDADVGGWGQRTGEGLVTWRHSGNTCRMCSRMSQRLTESFDGQSRGDKKVRCG